MSDSLTSTMSDMDEDDREIGDLEGNEESGYNQNPDADSSEEEEEDSEAERQVRDGFIVDDEDDDAEGDDDIEEDDDSGSRKKRKHKKRHHKLKRLKRHKEASPGSDVIDDDLLDDGVVDDLPDIRRIFDDDQGGRNLVDRALDDGGQADEEEDEFAGFIEEEEDDIDQREIRRANKKRQQNNRTAASLSSLDRDTWLEIQEVFGNGDDYAWALDDDTEENHHKPQPKLADIFEPSEITQRMLTKADDLIRSTDVPERLQLAFSTYKKRTPPPPESSGSSPPPQDHNSASLLFDEELPQAAVWVSQRISPHLTAKYVIKDDRGFDKPFRTEFLAAVQAIMRCLFVELYEVPFVWVQRRDLLVYSDPTALDPSERQGAFLSRDDIWRVFSLGMKYRIILDRKENLRRFYDKLTLEAPDLEFERMFDAIESTEEVADLHDWLSIKYYQQLKIIEQHSLQEQESNTNNESNNGSRKLKRKHAMADNTYQRAKSSMVSQFAKKIAMSSSDLVKEFNEKRGLSFRESEDLMVGPEEYAEEYTQQGSLFPRAESVIKAARDILATEIEKEPDFRRALRKIFKESGVVSVRPTDKGMTGIDEFHPFYSFKYLLNKPISAFEGSTQFLEILSAENDGLVTVDVRLAAEKHNSLVDSLKKIYLTDYESDTAQEWNELRANVIEDTVNKALTPIETWAKDMLKDDAEDLAGIRASGALEEYIEVAPYKSSGMEQGQTPAVVAISHGNGDPKRDSVMVISLDEEGLLQGNLIIDTLRGDPKHREKLQQFLQDQQPDVVVVGGFSSSTARLMSDLRQVVTDANEYIRQQASSNNTSGETEEPITIEAIYTYDHTARLYQNSRKATSEFPTLSSLGKYCVGLARYVQSPLHEFAALGNDMTAIYYESAQKYLSHDLLMTYLERALINVVNNVGIYINEAAHNPYHALLLPYVAGLGARKADSILSKLRQTVGTALSRKNLGPEGQQIISAKVFENSAAFLKFDYESVKKAAPATIPDKLQGPDILDTTRIHPSDYEVARKMAADAMELDEEDLQDLEHPSDIVFQLVDGGNTSKVDELSLDDFAVELKTLFGVSKRLILYMIRDELKQPYRDQRQPFRQPNDFEIFTILTGETRQTLDLGLIVPVRVSNNRRKDNGISVRLNSGIEGIIPAGYLTDVGDAGIDPETARSRFQVGQTIKAMITEINHREFYIEMSAQPSTIANGDLERRHVQPDQYFDNQQASMDKGSMEARKKRANGGRQRRLIDHPNFFNYNSGQAEQHLAGAQRGDCVVRPSSRGTDHLAITWKVDDDVYQHLDVLELDKTNDATIGRQLRVSQRYTYSDLDELIVSHIRALARKVDELMMSDKYKGSEDDLNTYLTNFCMAHIDRSAYGFAIDKNDAGAFILAFKANKNQAIQQWPVNIVPNAFVLPKQGEIPEAICPDIAALCNSFKTRYNSRQVTGRPGGFGGRTPYHGTATPAYGRTPNPYARAPTMYGGATPGGYAGGGTPGYPNAYGGAGTPGYGGSTHTPAYATMYGGGGSRTPR